MATNQNDTDELGLTGGSPLNRAAQAGLVLALLEAALQAQRAGSLEVLARSHPKAARWLMKKYWRALVGTAGDGLPAEPLTTAASLLLPWLVTQLRPDGAPSFDGLGEEHWLHRAHWRPMLAMACHQGLLAVPDFPRRYRRGQNEGALDNLCGLWGVDTSTLYRMLERGRQAITQQLLAKEPSARQLGALRAWVARSILCGPQTAEPGDEFQMRAAWHRRQCQRALSLRDPTSALWHCQQAHDAPRFVHELLKHTVVVAAEPEVDGLVEQIARLPLSPRMRVDLWLARAALERARNLPERELKACEHAREVAQVEQDALLLGIVHSALGRFYEQRDAERAFAFYQDSASFLAEANPQHDDESALGHFVTTCARLAWLYLLRNDERSKAVLDRAEALRAEFSVPDSVVGMLEQVWGQYWRREGNLSRSLEHRYRALNVFERLGDERSALAAYVNIGYDLAAQGDHERAIDYALRVLDTAARGGVEPEIVISAHFNIGAANFWRGTLDESIASYTTALEKSLALDQRLFAFRAHYNLAEAFYTRCRDQARPDDEAAGDYHVTAVLAAADAHSSPGVVVAARKLKSTILETAQEAPAEGLLSGDTAMYADELLQVQQQRQILAVPADPEPHARAHLAIARAYLSIAAKEREAALVLVQRAGVRDKYEVEFAQLQQTFERGLTHEQQLAKHWKQQADDVLDDTRRAALIAHLQREGAVNKSRYAEIGAVSPATASKHLAMLTERGLLVQQGKGPSTRYVLPA